MICVSVGKRGYEACANAVSALAFAEVRLDTAGLSLDETRRLFGGHPNLVATYRPGRAADEARLAALLAAVHAGAAYVDVELDAPEGYRQRLVGAAHDHRRRVIVSYHDHDRTPEALTLGYVVARCFGAGADIAKVACRVRTEQDNARLLGLLDSEKKIVVVGMGEKGVITRLAAPLLGAPFTFASLGEGEETAPGQWDYVALREALLKLGWGG